MTKSKKSSPVALTIAGSDSSGGAGIQADLKAFTVAEIYGASVITCITAQNTRGVQAIEPISLGMIGAQLEAVLNDLRPEAIKTGMLYSKEIIKIVSEKLMGYNNLMIENDAEFKLKLVIDPVLVATTGANLTHTEHGKKDYMELLKNSLFPMATVITPNLFEAEQLLDRKIITNDDRLHACKDLLNFGSEFVLLKGGHYTQDNKDHGSSQESIDLLYNGELKTFKSTRIPKDVHGTGCYLSALTTGFLAKGYEVARAVQRAKDFVTAGIRDSLAIGEGIEVVNIGLSLVANPDQSPIISKVVKAAEELTLVLKPYFVPEVGINLGYAKPDAKSTQDICALTGRIVRVGSGVDVTGKAEFGASKHIARIILTCMKNDEKVRAAMNMKYRPEIIDECKNLNFSIGSFDRGKEPGDTSSMEWGTKTVIEELGSMPDMIYDTGGIGKEPMIRVLGRDPEDVLGKVKRIIERFKEKN